MKINKIRRILFAFFIITFSMPALAFPLVDGVSALSTLIGVTGSVIAGIFPSLRKSKTSTSLISAIILLTVSLLGSFYFIDHQTSLRKSELDIVRQSRPDSQLNKDVMKRESSIKSPVLREDVEFYESQNISDTVISITDYKKLPKEISPEMVYIDFKESSVSFQPHIVTSFEREAYSNLAAYVSSINGNAIFAGGFFSDRVRAAREVYERTGFKVSIIKESDILSHFNNLSSSRPIPYATDSSIFDMNLYDLRSAGNIRQTHTVYNAKITTLTDLLLLPNWKIKELFDGKNAVFVDYYDNTYRTMNNVLADAGVSDFSFYQGGLKRHFEEGGNLTPDYYNQRVADPFKITQLVKETDKVRFLCLAQPLCMDNIPKDMMITLSYRDIGREAFFEELKSLPKDYLYVALSSNQETAGLAITAGYVLTNSGHQYIGELPMFERFSIEEIRHQIGRGYTYNTSLQEYRDNHWSVADVTSEISSVIKSLGWFSCFFAAGVVLRLFCFPLQSLVYNSYYFQTRQNPFVLLTALTIPVFIILAYFYLDDLISYYGIISHSTMSQLQREGSKVYVLIFLALVSIQSLISFPKRKMIAYGIITLMIGLYIFGYMDGIPQPMTSFLLGGEIAALATQMPYFYMYIKTCNAERLGYTNKALLLSKFTYPDKWKILNQFKKQDGYLIDTSIGEKGWKEVSRKLPKNTVLIVRSCSSKSKEQELGGFYESYICNSINDAYDKLKLLSDYGCSHAYIQKYEEFELTGVSSSISSNGKGIYYALGKPESATEGRKGVISGIISRSKSNYSEAFEKRIRDVMFSVEKAFNAPVSIEFGLSDKELRLFQIRILKRDGVNKLFPLSIDDYELGEAYLAKCSPLTGEVIELATKGNFIYIDGFLYSKKKPKLTKLVFTEKGYDNLKGKIEELLVESKELNSGLTSPSWSLERLKECIDIYKSLYKASLCRYTIERPVSLSDFEIAAASNSELEVDGYKLLTDCRTKKEDCVREGIHSLIVLNTYLINFHIKTSINADMIPENLSIKTLLDGSDPEALIDSRRMDNPLTQHNTDSIIVSGSIHGKPWNSMNKSLPDDGMKRILIGDEIPSDWVKQLDRFSGIISVFGHELSHLAISAKTLGIPYRKVSQEELEELLGQESITIE